MRIGYRFAWRYGDDASFHWSTVETWCPKCGRAAVVRLPDVLIAKQPDDTTHVCHPSVGGCNQGFSDQPLARPASKKRKRKG